MFRLWQHVCVFFWLSWVRAELYRAFYMTQSRDPIFVAKTDEIDRKENWDFDIWNKWVISFGYLAVFSFVRLFSNGSQKTSKYGMPSKELVKNCVCITRWRHRTSVACRGIENLQREPNWTAKSTNLIQNAKKAGEENLSLTPHA